MVHVRPHGSIEGVIKDTARRSTSNGTKTEIQREQERTILSLANCDRTWQGSKARTVGSKRWGGGKIQREHSQQTPA